MRVAGYASQWRGFQQYILDTSAGAGKVDSLGKFTVNDSAIFSGVMQETAWSSWTVAPSRSRQLALDTLHLSGGDLEIDSDSNGASTLTVNTLNWLALAVRFSAGRFCR